ncbi:MAG: MATE family efflux transporter [Myxococcales bacterium]|nr:MATE family efflux transporter [Myxococcales bacterium]
MALLGDTAMGLVDTRLVSGLGASSIGGVGLATTLMYLNYAAVFGLMRGVKVRAAHSLGEGRPSDALRYAQAGALLGFAAGVLVFFVARDISWALRALGVSPGLVAPAREFLAARTVLAPATCVLSAMIQWRQGVGDSKTPMRITLAGNIVNAGLAWALIHGRFGLPRLGVAGAGYATATAEALEASALLFVFARAWRESRAAREATGALGLGEALRAVLTVGGPTGLQFGVETLAFASFTTILGSLGEAGLAAHQIALATIRTSFLPGVAVGEAASVLVGRSLGRRALREADAVTRASLQTAVAFMALCGVVFALGGEALARAFTDDPAIVENVVRLLRVAAVFQVLDGVNIVLRGALRGAKDVRLPALLGITVVWVCVPGAAWFLGRQMGLGVLGGWLGFVGETTLCATVFYLRWRYGAWREAYRRPTKATGAVGALASVH